MKKAVFGGGCFWCTEAVFKMIDGVTSVLPGYMGPSTSSGQEFPTYESVSRGDTGYAEVVQVEYDAERVPYATLLEIFFAAHDPTQMNRQGNDVGTQYRSVIFYEDEEQKSEALRFIENLKKEKHIPAVTAVEPQKKFYPAEDYHHNYFESNKSAPYCQIIIAPKVEKVQKLFKDNIKK